MLQKATFLVARPAPPKTILATMTIDWARTLGIGEANWLLEVGKQAEDRR